MWLIITIFIALALTLCVWLVSCYWFRLIEIGCVRDGTSLAVWVGKGVVVPLLLWVGFNFVLIPGHVATMPRVSLANADAAVWTRIALELLIPAAPLVASCWAAATLTWLVVQLAVRTESRKEILGAGLFWGLVLSPFVALIIVIFGWPGVGVALLVLLAPILWDLLALGTPRRLPPVYERALERLKRGEHSAAEMEIIRQLERREDDFRGWMLLAEIYAKHFGDLPEAERTVRELCRQPNLTRAEFCEALMQLGDWYWQSDEVATAQAIWSEICKKFPHSEFADIARRRIERMTRQPKTDPAL